jgi:crotonobetainyl-CoA:carnitine CoA-transferase CaiB-like acyl-CoA transferase
MDQRDAFEDPHLLAREMFEETAQADLGAHLYPRAPFKMSRSDVRIRRGPVTLGQDNEYVYKTLLKLSDEEYDELVSAGHIGTEYAPHVE